MVFFAYRKKDEERRQQLLTIEEALDKPPADDRDTSSPDSNPGISFAVASKQIVSISHEGITLRARKGHTNTVSHYGAKAQFVLTSF